VRSTIARLASLAVIALAPALAAQQPDPHTYRPGIDVLDYNSRWTCPTRGA